MNENTNNLDELMSNIYQIIASFLGFVTFGCTWIYCISTYGFLFGVGLGWIPSFIVALMVGFCWPLIALIIIAILSIAYMN